MWRLHHTADDDTDDDNEDDNDNVNHGDEGDNDGDDDVKNKEYRQFPTHVIFRWNRGAKWCFLQRSCLASNNMFSMRFTEELREFQQSVRRESDAKMDIYTKITEMISDT